MHDVTVGLLMTLRLVGMLAVSVDDLSKGISSNHEWIFYALFYIISLP